MTPGYDSADCHLRIYPRIIPFKPNIRCYLNLYADIKKSVWENKPDTFFNVLKYVS